MTFDSLSPSTVGPTEDPVGAGSQPIATEAGITGLNPDALVSARGLTKQYGKFTAVDRLSFDIAEGSIFGLIGPNGAGKSTTFSMIASLLLPSSGQVRVAGLDPTRDPRGVRRVLGYMPDQLGIYGGLSATRYLEFFAAAYQIPRGEWPDLIDGLMELVGLEAKHRVDVDTMSRGMKQRMSLARALIHDPKLLILDEPASGLDPRARVELRQLIQHLAAMGKTIVISSHILSELQELCTDVAIIEGGRLLATGSPRQLASSLGTRRVKVRFGTGEQVEYPVADDDAQIELIRRLVAEDPRGVLEVSASGEHLEELFMNVTEGGVR